MLRRASVVCLAVVVGLGLSLVPRAVRAAGVFPDPVDCLAPAPNATPGTPEWTQRDLANQWCATQRQQDEWQHPAGGLTGAQVTARNYPAQILSQAGEPDRPRTGFAQWIPGATNGDPYRDPSLWTGAGRGRVQDITFISSDGAKLRGHVFAPPASVPGPYPGVVITTGSIQAYQEVYYWAAEGLAEAGYMVMTYDVQGQGQSETLAHPCSPSSCPGVPFQQDYNFFQGTRDALNWFFSTANPMRASLDAARVGIAGHSLGASAVSQVGQEDPRVHAIVAWDNLGATTVTPHAPALGLNAEYFLNPTYTSSPPDPHAKDHAYQSLKAAGVDTMQVALRQATHLEFSYIPYILPASRLGERVAFHYTLAWFDKYLRGDATALSRLTATQFDGSSDAHSIGLGTWQPPTGNVPYKIDGLKVPDRLSIYYTSGYFLDGGAEQCADMRAGCP
jgi:dienelactone hydrolase